MSKSEPLKKKEAEGEVDLSSASMPPARDLDLKKEKKRIRDLVSSPSPSHSSLSDMAYAVLMEKYLPKYSAVPGLSFQVKIGQKDAQHSYYADFHYRSLIIENHQPVFWRKADSRIGDFPNPTRKQEFLSALKNAETQEEKRQIRRDTRQELLENYGELRSAILAANPALKDHELVIVSSPMEFHDKVLRRVLGGGAPDPAVFIREFEALKDEAYRCLPKDAGRGKKGKPGTDDACVRDRGRRGRRNFFGFRG